MKLHATVIADNNKENEHFSQNGKEQQTLQLMGSSASLLRARELQERDCRGRRTSQGWGATVQQGKGP